MRHPKAIASVVMGVALSGLIAGTPATAAVSTVTGDIKGTITTVASSSATIAVTATPASLRLIKGRTVKVMTDAKTLITLDRSRASVRDLVAGDAVSARVRCTFTITSTYTRIACRAIRITAVSPTPVTPIPTGPVTFVVTGKVAGLQKSALAITASRFDADAQAGPVVTALLAAPPLWFAVDSATVVMLGSTNATFASVSGGNTVTVHVTCQPKLPYNCKATRIEIALPGKEPVKVVGLITQTTNTTVTLNVESVVHTEVATTDVHMLRISQLIIGVPSGTSITAGGTATTLGALPIGVRITVLAQCRLVVPFECTAERITQ